jgi:outer membrane lipoprotein-sorting protein
MFCAGLAHPSRCPMFWRAWTARRRISSLAAGMKRVQFTAVLSESSEMDGAVRLRRTKGGTQGIVEFKQPEQRTVFVNGKQVQIYYPKANTVEIYDTSKYTSNMDQILLLGFGTSAAELKKLDIKDDGVQKIGGRYHAH